MTKTQLKDQVQTLAEEENITFIEACQAMQAAAAKMGNEQMIMVLHEIKMEEVNLR